MASSEETTHLSKVLRSDGTLREIVLRGQLDGN
jgi:hypothetical protein